MYYGWHKLVDLQCPCSRVTTFIILSGVNICCVNHYHFYWFPDIKFVQYVLNAIIYSEGSSISNNRTANFISLLDSLSQVLEHLFYRFFAIKIKTGIIFQLKVDADFVDFDFSVEGSSGLWSSVSPFDGFCSSPGIGTESESVSISWYLCLLAGCSWIRSI